MRLGHLRVTIVFDGNTRFVHDDYLGNSALLYGWRGHQDRGGCITRLATYLPVRAMDFQTWRASVRCRSGFFYIAQTLLRTGDPGAF